jgi:hypothetical protein
MMFLEDRKEKKEEKERKELFINYSLSKLCK